MQDRRQQIVEAGLATLREHGYAGFTQPRVAARANLRQSHLTYYHPTRLDLLAAVGRTAVDRQLAAVEATLGGLSSPEAAAGAIAGLVSRHENTRVLMALAQAADEEPRLRELFRELADGIVARIARSLLKHHDPTAVEGPARLLHALSVGLAVVGLATGRPDGEQRAARVLEAALRLVAGGTGPAGPPPAGAPIGWAVKGRMSMNKPVLIVGAGPVGMTLASELTRYGVGVRIVDKAMHRTDKSKAMVLWSRTLELLDRGGARGSAPFVEAGFKVSGVAFVAGGKEVGRVAMDRIPSAYNYALTIPQSETERLLEERLAGQGVAVERGTEATAFTMGPDGVDAVLRRADGQEETVRACWLVGCDGAHSAVRHALGAAFSGETLLSDWFLADVHMAGYPRPDTDASIHWHRDGVLIIFPIKPGRYRTIGDLPCTDTKVPSAPTLEQVQALVNRRGPVGATVFDPIWLSGFRINGRKVAEYRHGRVFLAGDAAHVHSPAGGQGMNTGMQDAMNLAWKLALVVRGACRESLLDSYSPERSAVGDQVLEAAGRLTAVATIKNPIAQGLRNLAGHMLLGLPRVTHEVADTMSEVAIHYPGSPLNGPGLHGGPRPGERVAPVAGQRPVGSGDAPLFTLFAERGPETEELVRRFGGLLDPEVRPPLRAGAVWLARPDGYVAMAVAQGKWGEVGSYLGRLAAPSV